MHSLNDTALESNKYMKIDFDGGDLSSDAGLLFIKEFACKLGFDKILKAGLKTNDPPCSAFIKMMRTSGRQYTRSLALTLKMIVQMSSPIILY